MLNALVRLTIAPDLIMKLVVSLSRPSESLMGVNASAPPVPLSTMSCTLVVFRAFWNIVPPAPAPIVPPPAQSVPVNSLML